MGPLHFNKWVLLAVIFIVNTEGAPESSPWITPIPNMDAAMEGYDPIIANPLERPDPGIRNQIFEPMNEISNGRVVVNSFIDKGREDLHCDVELSGKTIRNYNEYRDEKSSSHDFSMNADISASFGIGLFSFSAAAGYGRQSTAEERNMQRLFQESNGEVIECKAVCITHVVGISLFEKPVFTAAFMTALRNLHFAAKTPDSDESRKVYVKFVQSYGTHFMKRTFLGSKLIFEKRFSSKSLDSETESSRSKCVTNSAYSSLGVNKLALEVSASFDVSSEKCNAKDASKSFFRNNGFSSEKVISIGSLPHGDLEKWSNTVKESPVPIHYELEKISTLFQSEWFNTITVDHTDPTAEKLNGTKMYDFFEKMSARFCVLLLGEECALETQGCGYNSLCRFDQTCVNDPKTNVGYTCSDINKYGPVLIVGGNNVQGSTRILSNGDAFDTWKLPDLPHGVAGNTLSVVGSKIYSCGGFRNGESVTSSCYLFDRSAVNGRWTSTTSLPTAMRFHTAVTIKDHIWFVHNGNLYDLNTVNKNIHTFPLPMTVTDGHCAVSNGSHSFIILPGPSRLEIWVNTKEYNPGKWHRVGYMRSGRYYFGCVWFEQMIYIAGGWHSRNDAEVFDIMTSTSKSAGTLQQGRREAGMVVFEGKPAVLGGRDDKVPFDSIETYDVKTGRWTINSRRLVSARCYHAVVQLQG